MRQYVARPGQECKSELIVGAGLERVRWTDKSKRRKMATRDCVEREKIKNSKIPRKNGNNCMPEKKKEKQQNIYIKPERRR